MTQSKFYTRRQPLLVLASQPASCCCYSLRKECCISHVQTTKNISLILYVYFLASIAFKPAESGWGGGSKYSKNFDAIFGNKNTDEKKDDKPTDEKKDSEK